MREQLLLGEQELDVPFLFQLGPNSALGIAEDREEKFFVQKKLETHLLGQTLDWWLVRVPRGRGPPHPPGPSMSSLCLC